MSSQPVSSSIANIDHGVISNITYNWNNAATANSWTAIGNILATNTTVSTPTYTISESIDKSVRPYYRLKIFIDKTNGGNDVKTIPKDILAEEKTHYNALITSNILDEEKTIYSLQSENWKQSRLIQLYKNAVEKNKKVMKKYKSGEKICFDSGFDLFCPSYYIFENFDNSTKKIDHCVKCSMDKVETDTNGKETCNPVGYYLYPRSSTGTKTPLALTNSVGIIDSGYRGNIIAAFHCARANKYTATLYQRLVQICPPDLSYPIEVVIVHNEKELGPSQRGTGGFGSTGV